MFKGLISLTAKPNIRVMEIGFNGGHSAEVILKSNATLTLTSFDLGDHDYMKYGKEYIDRAYPSRHTLIVGDSKVTLPKYISENPDVKYDVIFIDGGHDYPTCKSDLHNCMKLAHKDTIVMVDDTMHTPKWSVHWNVEVTQMWNESVSAGIVTEIARKDYQPGRGMSWGKYANL